MRDPLVIVLIIAVALIFFGGRGRISNTMGDIAAGIKNFRKGLKDADKPETAPPTPQQIVAEPVNVTPEKDRAKTS
jgi:sec-independent protein translocase protein TatA